MHRQQTSAPCKNNSTRHPYFYQRKKQFKFIFFKDKIAGMKGNDIISNSARRGLPEAFHPAPYHKQE